MTFKVRAGRIGNLSSKPLGKEGEEVHIEQYRLYGADAGGANLGSFRSDEVGSRTWKQSSVRRQAMAGP